MSAPMSAVMSAVMSAGVSAVMSVVMSAVLLAQEPVAQKPVGAIPVDSVTPEDSARVDSLLQRHRNNRCWRARPMPECRMVFLTDIGFEFPLYSTTTTSTDPSHKKSFPIRAAWSIGLMRNGDRHSHGVSLGFTTETSRKFPQILEYRYRNWLGGGSAVDAGIGWKRNSVWLGSGQSNAQGMTFLLGYTPSRWVGANVRYDLVNAGGRTHRGVMLGVQSTRVSEYMFKGLALAIVDGLLAKIGFEREQEE